MRIVAIDTRWIRSTQTDGIGQYGLNLLRELVKKTNCSTRHDNFKFIALFDQKEIMDFVRSEVGSHSNLEMTLTPNKLFSIADLVTLPFFLKKRGVSVYHALNIFFSPFHFSYSTVVTVHDLIPIISPPPLLEGSFFRKFFFSFRGFTSYLLSRADVVISVSESTKRDLKRIFSLENIQVIHPGINKDFAKKPLPEEWEEFCTQKRLLKPFILFVGRMDRHKGLVELLEAYISLPEDLKEKYTLVVTGKKKGPARNKTMEIIQKNNMESNVLFLGHVDEEELHWLYSKSRLFVFPSLYEGFGLPLLEAMSSCVPIVAGNNSSIPEVAMGAAVLADPKDTEFYKSAMIIALTNTALRKRMIKQGMDKALKFNWENTAEQTLLLYRPRS